MTCDCLTIEGLPYGKKVGDQCMDRTEFDRFHPAPNVTGVEFLYKFKAFDEKKPQLLTEIFEQGLLYFPTPEQLNDPWECQSTAEMPVTRPEIAAAKHRLTKTLRQGKKSKKEADALADWMLADSDRFIEMVKTSIKDTTRGIRIMSFAAERDNALLWAHYANSHRGICIEFSSKTILYELAYRVHYQENYPSFKYPHDLYDALHTIVTKSIDWNYEREYRAFDVPSSKLKLKLRNGKFRLENGAISRVYFGALMPPEHQNQIIKSIKVGPFSPELFKAALRTDAYKLGYSRID